MAWTEIANPISIEECPAKINISLNPNSNAMKFVRKWVGCDAQTGGIIDCLALGRRVRGLVVSDGMGKVSILCQELESGRCNFPKEDEEEVLPET